MVGSMYLCISNVDSAEKAALIGVKRNASQERLNICFRFKVDSSA